MENADQPYGFLNTEDSRKYFAELDLALKSGRHIQGYAPDEQLFAYCETWYDELAGYYGQLFRMELKRGYQPEHYYYLEFREEERGKIPSSMVQVLDGVDVILGILLLNYAEEKFLEPKKELTLDDIKELLWSPERREHTDRLFSKGGDESFNSRDDARLKVALGKSLGRMDRLGWVRIVEKDGVKWYEVMPSLSRLADLYGKEIGAMEVDETEGNSELPGGSIAIAES